MITEKQILDRISELDKSKKLCTDMIEDVEQEGGNSFGLKVSRKCIVARGLELKRLLKGTK
jgi:uncharacterized protein (UPF0335 family)